jgi:hypothetical protein
MTGRYNFSHITKHTVKWTSGYICSNPSCRKFLWASGPNNTTIFNGKVAHIVAASEVGPRASEDYVNDQGTIINDSNGIVLCMTCESFVDSNEKTFTVDLLRQWKTDSEKLFEDFRTKYFPSEVPLDATIPTTVFRDNPDTTKKFEMRIKALEKLANLYQKKSLAQEKQIKDLTLQMEKNLIDDQDELKALKGKIKDQEGVISKLQTELQQSWSSRVSNLFKLF